MPYRRLPNTDQARLRALHAAITAGQKKSPDELAFSVNTLARLRAFYTGFETTIIHHKLARHQQEKNSSTYQETVRKARLYLSHFVQILNFAIQRGDMKQDVRKHYGIDEEKKIPSFLLDSEVLEWGKKIIEGEHQRVLHGGNPIYNPSIAVVKVKFDQFLDAYHFQKTLQNNTARWTAKVADLRNEADEIILDIWNEVEDHFAELADDLKREKTIEYGLTYVYRPMERIRTDSKAVQTTLAF
jgi:antirestriction protein ArdC